MKNILKTLHSKSSLLQICQLQSHLPYAFRLQPWLNGTIAHFKKIKSVSLSFLPTQNLPSNLLIIITIISLMGCGRAAKDVKDPASIDEQAPEIVRPTPDNNTETSVNTRRISIVFTEEINDAGIMLSNIFSISPPIKGSWHYEKANKKVQFTVDDSVTTLPLNQTYTVTISTALKDLAGNPLANEYQFSFFTPKNYAVSATVQGLTGKLELQLNATQPGSSEVLTDNIALEAQGNDISYAFNKKLILNSDFEIVIVSQPMTDQFCAISQGSRQVSTNTTVTISCSPVHPEFINASNWNDYVNASNGDLCTSGPECLHGGERRQVTVPPTHSCENLRAKDALDAFEWQCITNSSVTPEKIQMHSIRLKDDKHLSDLIDFDTRRWKPNKVIITTIDNNHILLETTPSVWWSNPVIEHKSGDKLQSSGTIYVIDSTTVNRLVIEKNKIAVLARPVTKDGDVFTVTLQHNGNSIVVSNINYFWLEGRFQTANPRSHSNNVINISGSHHSVLRKVVVFDAEKDGIKISNSQYITLHNVGAHNNDENGILISSNTQKTRLHNIQTGSNGINGVHIEGTRNVVHGAISANNGESGILVSGAKNAIIQVATYNNGQHGLFINKTNNNTLSIINSSANVQNGLTLTNSHHTVLTHLSLINNDSSGFSSENATHTTLVDVNATLNQEHGLTINDAAPTVVKNAVIAFNGGHGITTLLSDDVNFAGFIDIGLNTAFNCQIADSNECPNSITALPDTATLTDSFVGRITEGLPTSSNYKNEQAKQWTMTHNPYQSWSNLSDINALPTSAHCTAISINNCALWDWSLTLNDSIFLNKVDTTTTENTITSHRYSDSDTTPIEFLANSFELIGSPQGNDNGLCEEAETCITAANVGAYQGHGHLIATSMNDDTSSRVFFKLMENGYE